MIEYSSYNINVNVNININMNIKSESRSLIGNQRNNRDHKLEPDDSKCHNVHDKLQPEHIPLPNDEINKPNYHYDS